MQGHGIDYDRQKAQLVYLRNRSATLALTKTGASKCEQGKRTGMADPQRLRTCRIVRRGILSAPFCTSAARRRNRSFCLGARNIVICHSSRLALKLLGFRAHGDTNTGIPASVLGLLVHKAEHSP